MLSNYRLRDVVFGDTAFSYEEGKWVIEDGRKRFLPDLDIARIQLAEIQNFTHGKAHFKYGEYVSGMAVREDATTIFKQAREMVCHTTPARSVFANSVIVRSSCVCP